MSTINTMSIREAKMWVACRGVNVIYSYRDYHLVRHPSGHWWVWSTEKLIRRGYLAQLTEQKFY